MTGPLLNINSLASAYNLATAFATHAYASLSGQNSSEEYIHEFARDVAVIIIQVSRGPGALLDLYKEKLLPDVPHWMIGNSSRLRFVEETCFSLGQLDKDEIDHLRRYVLDSPPNRIPSADETLLVGAIRMMLTPAPASLEGYPGPLTPLESLTFLEFTERLLDICKRVEEKIDEPPELSREEHEAAMLRTLRKLGSNPSKK